MWHSLHSARNADPRIADSADELLASTVRLLMYIVFAMALACFCAGLTIWWSDVDAWKVYAVSPLFIATWWLAFVLLPKNRLVSQGVWQAGLALLITACLFAFRTPAIAYAYVLLPFMAAITTNGPAALATEGVVCLLTWWLWHTPGPRLLPTADAQAVGVASAIAFVFGWVSTRSLFTVIAWSLFSLEQADQGLEEARQHRAQLYLAEKNLAGAYYRLERTNTALVAAWKAAEDAERMKAQFVSNVSHELRTPLNLIIGFSELMTTSPESYDGVPLPGPYRSDMNALHDSAQHLLALADDVLDLARIEVGKISLVREASEMSPLIAEAANVLQDYITAKGLELRVSMAPGLPKLWMDRLRIRQVLLNLLVNAARFTERGYIGVEAVQSEDEVLVRVIDTGRGIPPAELPHIFEEFHSTEQTSTNWHSGSGLGLPLSKKFVELHHGRIGVESMENRGSVFWFTLPCALPDCGEQPGHDHWTSAPVIQLESTEPAIVVAHDDSATVALFRRYLEGYQVVAANDLASGMRLAVEHKAVALVTGSGASVPVLPAAELPIISCPLPDGKQMAAALGAADLLVKPVSVEALQAALQRLERPFGKVLVADDDPDIVRLFRRMLRTYAGARDDGEIQCLEAYTGEEALDLIRSELPDLVLLDLIMPGVTGETIIQRMVADPATAGIPVIVVSAHAQNYTRQRLSGPIQVVRDEGYQMADIVRVVESLVRTLAPGWHHPAPTGPGPASAPGGSPASAGIPRPGPEQATVR